MSFHTLKCYPAFFEKSLEGVKTFEVRRNDRDFRVGDTITLKEWLNKEEKFSGREMTVEVTYILTADDLIRQFGWSFLNGEYVVMAVKPVDPPDTKEAEAA